MDRSLSQNLSLQEAAARIQVTLLGDVASDDVIVRAIEQRSANAAENVRIQSETVQVTLDRYEAGDVSELDVSLAGTLLFRTQAAIPQLARERDLAINACHGSPTALLLGTDCIFDSASPLRIDCEHATAESGAGDFDWNRHRIHIASG